ncbi:hypothetical protein HNQ94_001747 [Salirhabdus euzebyi]|uniref:Polysaccharide deacetylase n=1 Tax=Salirhabdus euzebyi TaxID=394506 RepID=A0A841Q4F0_9BACI|nr:hypothetical protein [Salirhabdus euzebyi]MBB6453299.1 hypothetical protein [Salirhabdus euzebyi]
MKELLYRMHSDFFLPNRLGEYKKILQFAIDNGYEMHSISSFWKEINTGLNPKKRYFINRHDIDSDIKRARKIVEIEREIGIISSFYFRLSTLDFELMKEIEKSGGEASYHFEEIATYAKEKNIQSRDLLYEEEHMDRIRQDFKTHLHYLREVTGLPMRTVASHGDFANRKLNIINHELLSEDVRKELGIDLEVYDDTFMQYVTSRHADRFYPEFYYPSSPMEAIKNGEKVIYFLSHPRQWGAAPLENAKQVWIRLYEGWKFK